MTDDSPEPSTLAFVVLGPVMTVLVFLVVSYTVFGPGAVPFGLAAGLTLAIAEYLAITRADENRPS